MRKKFILLSLVAILFGVLMACVMALFHDLPQIQSLASFKPPTITSIYSADNVLLGELYSEKRETVGIEQIPENLINALLVTEDRNFYRHSGIDIKGIARALLKDLLAGKYVEGASTITQQLAKTLFLTPRKTILRKLKEAVLAIQLERRYTKNEILTLYLNQVYLGSGAYGVQLAARIYFGKPAHQLTLAECALVAGMPQAPSRLSPRVNVEKARNRRNIVLRQMHQNGLISTTAYEEALASPINLTPAPHLQTRAPYFMDYIKNQLEAQVGADQLYKGGLTVHTTLNSKSQEIARQAVIQGLANLQKRMAKSGNTTDPPQAALVCLNLQTGGIEALVGGRTYALSNFNRATHARRQPGSAFKPFVYGLAIERGFSQNQLVLDSPVVYQVAQKEWRPQNFSKTYAGEISYRYALARSKNIPAVRLIETLGPVSVVNFAHSLGIRSPLAPNLSLALGTSEVVLLDLTAAYGVFPRGGRSVEPYGVTAVYDHQKRLLWRAAPVQKLVMSQIAAAIMTDMLQAVVTEGTGRQAKRLGIPLAGKTGTTNDYKDALFVGFSPLLVTGVWVGSDEYKSLGTKETGARAALPIWIDFMGQVSKKHQISYFDLPPETVQVTVDARDGHPVPAGSRGSTSALFDRKSAPQSSFE